MSAASRSATAREPGRVPTAKRAAPRPGRPARRATGRTRPRRAAARGWCVGFRARGSPWASGRAGRRSRPRRRRARSCRARAGTEPRATARRRGGPRARGPAPPAPRACARSTLPHAAADDRSEIDPPHPDRSGAIAGGRLRREPRLADAGGADQRHEPLPAQGGVQCRELAAAADEARPVAGQRRRAPRAGSSSARILQQDHPLDGAQLRAGRRGPSSSADGAAASPDRPRALRPGARSDTAPARL